MSQSTVGVILFLAFTLSAYLLFNVSSRGVVFYQQRTAEHLQKRLTGLFMFHDAKRWSVIYVLSLIGGPLLIVLAQWGVFKAALCFVFLLVFPRVFLAIMAIRRARAINAALPDALSQLSSSMRAGSTFTVALQALAEEDAGPLGEELSLLLREHRIGARMDDALDSLAERVQSEEMDLVVSAVLIAQDVGGNLAEILQGLSETIRQKLTMEGKVAALTSQGVMQGYVVSALPFALLGALSVIEPEATLPIFNCLLGWMVLSVMAVLQISGAMMIRKIVSIEI